MNSLRLMIEAARADEGLAAQTTDQELQSVIARERPDLREALAANPSAHPDLLAWLAEQGVKVPLPAQAAVQDDAEADDAEAETDETEPEGEAEPDVEPEDESDDAEAETDVETEDADDDFEDELDEDEDDSDESEDDDPEDEVDEAESEDQDDEDSDGATAVVVDSDADEADDESDEDEDDDPEDEVDEAESEDQDDEDDEADEAESEDEDDEDSDAAVVVVDSDADEADDESDEEDEDSDAAAAESAQSASAQSAAEEAVVAPMPSAKDIAAWAETPDTAPDTYTFSEQDAIGSPYAYSPAYAAVPQPQVKEAARPAQGSTTKLLGVIIVLLLVIVAGGGALVLKQVWGDEKETQVAGSQEAGSQGDGSQGFGSQGGVTEGDGAGTSVNPNEPSRTNPTHAGKVTVCSERPAVKVRDMKDEEGSLRVKVMVTPACTQGDYLDDSRVHISTYGAPYSDASGTPEVMISSGEFDFSSNPLIIPPDGTLLDLVFKEGHYFRLAADVRPQNGDFENGILAGIEVTRNTTTLNSRGLSNPREVTAAEISSDRHVAREEIAVQSALTWYIGRDAIDVRRNLVGKWTPQLSSKRTGLVSEGKTWDARASLHEFLTLKHKHPKARLLNSDDWPVFDSGGGWWVTLAGESFSGPEAANAWCDAQGYDADHCFAKKMHIAGTPEGTTQNR